MNNLPVPVRHQLLLLVAPSSESSLLFDLAARLVLQTSLFVMDAGNTFQGYGLAHILKRWTLDYEVVLHRITLARVFTCYQMLALLSQCAAGPQPGPDQPVLVLDFLSTFYDQGVPVGERSRLLNGCIAHLRQLSRRAPVAVWVRRRDCVPPEGLEYFSRLQAAAGQVWLPEKHPALVLKQAGLLDG